MGLSKIDQAIQDGTKRLVEFTHLVTESGRHSWVAKVGQDHVASILEDVEGFEYRIVYRNGGANLFNTTRTHRGDLDGAQSKVQANRGWV